MTKKGKTAKHETATDGKKQGEKTAVTGKETEEIKDTGDKAPAKPEPSKEELLEAEVASLKDQLLRSLAEMENSRKRLEKQKHDALKYASLPLMRDLLLVMDNLELALKYADQKDPLRDGVNMALDGMKKTLEQHHLKPIKTSGEKFDPVCHEAVSIHQNPDVEDNVIIEEQRVGYLLHDRVVRPSGVVVNRKPEKAAEPEPKEGQQ